MAMGTPCRGPRYPLARISRCAASAAWSARLASVDTNAWMTGLTRSIRSRQARVSSTGDTPPRLISRATSASDRHGQSEDDGIARLLQPGLDAKCEDRLDVVGQLEVPELLDVLHHAVQDHGNLLEIGGGQRVAGEIGDRLEWWERHGRFLLSTSRARPWRPASHRRRPRAGHAGPGCNRSSCVCAAR